ncbi:hypothetical protein [Piscirickettsia salmonis]|nr:hypothetical protein [Piscirickettsia salmonis]
MLSTPWLAAEAYFFYSSNSWFLYCDVQIWESERCEPWSAKHGVSRPR